MCPLFAVQAHSKCDSRTLHKALLCLRSYWLNPLFLKQVILALACEIVTGLLKLLHVGDMYYLSNWAKFCVQAPSGSEVALHLNTSETEENVCVQSIVLWPISCDLSSQKALLRNICSVFFIEVCNYRFFTILTLLLNFLMHLFVVVICTVFLCRLKCVD